MSMLRLDESICPKCGRKGHFFVGDVRSGLEQFECPNCGQMRLPYPPSAGQDATKGENQGARRGGLLKLAIGTLVAAGIAVSIHLGGLARGAETSLVKLPFAIAAAYALLGAVEVVSGVPSAKLASKWNALSGWQRGVVGTLIAFLAFCVAGSVVWLVTA